MDEDIIVGLIVALAILVPVFGFTVRLALMPLLDRILALFEARQSGQEVELLEKRLQLVEQDLRGVHREVERLDEERDFYRSLESSRESPGDSGSAGSARPR